MLFLSFLMKRLTGAESYTGNNHIFITYLSDESKSFGEKDLQELQAGTPQAAAGGFVHESEA